MTLLLHRLTVLSLIGSDAFAVQLNSYFKKVQSDSRAKNVLRLIAKTSRARCAGSCSATKGCHGYSFNKDSCELTGIDASSSLESKMKASPGFNFYYSAGKKFLLKSLTFFSQKPRRNYYKLYNFLSLINVEIYQNEMINPRCLEVFLWLIYLYQFFPFLRNI